MNDPDGKGLGCFATVVLGFLAIVGFSLPIAWDVSDNHDGDFFVLFYFILIALVMLAVIKLYRDENRKRREELRKNPG